MGTVEDHFGLLGVCCGLWGPIDPDQGAQAPLDRLIGNFGKVTTGPLACAGVDTAQRLQCSSV